MQAIFVLRSAANRCLARAKLGRKLCAIGWQHFEPKAEKANEVGPSWRRGAIRGEHYGVMKACRKV